MSHLRSSWAIATLVLGLASTGAYAYAVSGGKVAGSPTEAFVPSEVRAQPNGYRSFHFWHVGYGGYRGGK